MYQPDIVEKTAGLQRLIESRNKTKYHIYSMILWGYLGISRERKSRLILKKHFSMTTIYLHLSFIYFSFLKYKGSKISNTILILL
jgi:hypothetical protein